jgi:hypothetical protein
LESLRTLVRESTWRESRSFWSESLPRVCNSCVGCGMMSVLIAGDIIRTVATSPTFQSVGIQGSIVLIRTFLSLALNLEVEGRLPWQRGRKAEAAP